MTADERASVDKMPVAIDHPPTRAGLRRRWLRAFVPFSAGLALLAPVVLMGVESWGLAPYAVIIGVPLLAFGLFGLIAATLVSRAVRRYAWQPATAQYTFNPFAAAVVAANTESGKRIVLRVLTPMPFRQRAVGSVDGGEVWVAGEGDGLGVIAPPPGDELVLVVRPPRGSAREARLERILDGA